MNIGLMFQQGVRNTRTHKITLLIVNNQEKIVNCLSGFDIDVEKQTSMSQPYYTLNNFS
jgi:hypothetical protein